MTFKKIKRRNESLSLIMFGDELAAGSPSVRAITIGITTRPTGFSQNVTCPTRHLLSIISARYTLAVSRNYKQRCENKHDPGYFLIQTCV